MCGIAGFNWENKKLIKRMISIIAYRGPDDSGTYTDKNISLGHRRLSIIDLSKRGHQPMSDEKGKIQLIFNGEIYNFKVLREDLEKKGYKFKSNTDTETILHGYIEYGEKIFSKLDGMFAIAIYETKKRKLILARDRTGKKPLYYYHKDNKLIFSSEIKAILEHDIDKSIDEKTFLDLLNSRFSPGNTTIFKNIRKVPPSGFLVYQEKKIEINYFWKIEEKSGNSVPDIKKVDSLISEAVKKRLIADVPIGVFLSGGLDSSTITAYMKRFTDRISTFSIGFDDNTNESKYAKIVSESLETDHNEILLDKEILKFLPQVIWHLDEPISDPASLPTYLLSEKVSKKVKVALSGEGGDEVFGGYHTYNYIPNLERYAKIPYRIRKNFLAQILRKSSGMFGYPKKQILKLGSEVLKQREIKEMYKKLHYYPFEKPEITEFTGKVLKEDVLDKHLKGNDLYQASVNYYLKDWLPNDLLMKVDKTSMAHGLEVRAPFLDKNLIEHFAKLDKKYKLNRYLFRKTIYKKIPKKILRRKKQGFTLPISNWTSNKDFVARITPQISDLIKRDLFRKEPMEKLLKNPQKYRNDHKLWTLLNFEIWFKLYVDNIKSDKIRL